jgi:hypothetical protein
MYKHELTAIDSQVNAYAFLLILYFVFTQVELTQLLSFFVTSNI